MKRLNFDFTGVTQIDWARLAAFIDGEGHIRVVSKTQKVKRGVYHQEYLEITIVNTSLLLIQWLAHSLGGSVASRRASDRCKPQWSWIVGSAHTAEILKHCLPYFIIKREQAELALAFYATMRRRGVKGTPQSVRDERAEIRTQLRVLTARGPQKIEAAS